MCALRITYVLHHFQNMLCFEFKKTKIRYVIIIVARIMTSKKLEKMSLKSRLGLMFTKINWQKLNVVVSVRNQLNFPRGGFWVSGPVKVAFLCGFVHFRLVKKREN